VTLQSHYSTAGCVKASHLQAAINQHVDMYFSLLFAASSWTSSSTTRARRTAGSRTVHVPAGCDTRLPRCHICLLCCCPQVPDICYQCLLLRSSSSSSSCLPTCRLQLSSPAVSHVHANMLLSGVKFSNQCLQLRKESC
jgi:hypothetical protein